MQKGLIRIGLKCSSAINSNGVKFTASGGDLASRQSLVESLDDSFIDSLIGSLVGSFIDSLIESLVESVDAILCANGP